MSDDRETVPQAVQRTETTSSAVSSDTRIDSHRQKSSERKDKTIIYVDMDFVLTDYRSGFMKYRAQYPDIAFPQSVEGFFLNLNPIPDAIDAWQWLDEHPSVDPFILTAPSVRNAHSYSEKRLWVGKHLGLEAAHRLIISPNKGLNQGDFLIDDNLAGKGQENFKGKIIHFGSADFPNWESVVSFLERTP